MVICALLDAFEWFSCWNSLVCLCAWARARHLAVNLILSWAPAMICSCDQDEFHHWVLFVVLTQVHDALELAMSPWACRGRTSRGHVRLAFYSCVSLIWKYCFLNTNVPHIVAVSIWKYKAGSFLIQYYNRCVCGSSAGPDRGVSRSQKITNIIS